MRLFYRWMRSIMIQPKSNLLKLRCPALIILLSFGSVELHAQPILWAKQAVSSGPIEGFDMTVDALGNIYVCGDHSQDQIAFDGISLDVSFGAAFIAKYNPQGEVQWARSVSGGSENGMRALAYHNNAVYVCGIFEQTNSLTILDFGEFQLSGDGEPNLFLAKISLDGTWEWVKAIHTSDDLGPYQQTTPEEMIILPNGDIIMSGYCETSSVTIEGTVYPTNPDGSLFFTSFNENGDLNWFRTAETGSLFELEMNRSTQGVYFGGTVFGWPISYDSQELANSDFVSEEVVIGEISSNGDLLWWWAAGNFEGQCEFGGMDIDDSGDLRVSMRTSGVNGITINSIEYDATEHVEALFRLDSLGQVEDFDYTYTGFHTGFEGGLYVNEVLTAGDGTTYVTGKFESPSFLKPTFFGDTIGGEGLWESFVSAYDSSGQYLGVVSFEFESFQSGRFEVLEMVLDHEENVIITGFFVQDVTVGNFNLMADNQNQMFIIKLDATEGFGGATELVEFGAEHINLFPNPFHDQISIQLEEHLLGSTCRLMDLSGRVLMSNNVAESSLELDLFHLPAGTYIIQIEAGDSSFNRLIIKQ